MRWVSLPAVAAAALIVLACSGTSLPSPSPSPAVAPATPSADPATPATTARPITPAPPATPGVAWERVSGTHGIPDEVLALAAAPNGFIAIARDSNDVSPSSAAVFASPDGRVWERRTLEQSLGATAADVAVGADGFVVVGSRAAAEGARARLVDTCEREPGGRQGAIWWSDDGVTWTSAGSGRLFRPGHIGSVAPHGGGFVATGGWTLGEHGASMAWVSPDGRSWDRAGDASALQAGAMADVATDGNAIIAVGGTRCGTVVPLAWTSTDGRSWSVTEIGTRGEARTVAAGPVGFLAAGWSGDDEAPLVAWRSADGRSWQPVPMPPNADWIRDVVGLPDRYLVVTENAGILSSADAETWTPVFHPTLGMPARIAVGRDVAVVMGSVPMGGEGEPIAIWTLPVASLP